MRCRGIWPLLFLGLLSLSPLKASAQAAAPAAQASPAAAPQPGYPPPGYGYGPPPGYGPAGYGPPPYGYAPPMFRPEPGVHRHDGFYLRMGTGIAYGHASRKATLSSGSSGAPEKETITFKGSGPAYELLIGGVLGHGFVLGGGFVGQDILDPTIRFSSGSESSSLSVDGALGVGAMGPFIDWFPQEDKGLHFGTMIGFGILGLMHASSGIGGSVWGGYDFWVGNQWCLGFEGRVAAMRSNGSFRYSGGTMDLKDSAISAELLFTALYN